MGVDCITVDHGCDWSSLVEFSSPRALDDRLLRSLDTATGLGILDFRVRVLLGGLVTLAGGFDEILATPAFSWLLRRLALLLAVGGLTGLLTGGAVAVLRAGTRRKFLDVCIG